MTALELRDVRKVYRSGDEDVIALDHANLSIGDDEMVALVGPSGSGKSTLISIAGGLLTPTDGTVLVGDEDITQYTPRRLTRFRRESVGFVFQTVNLVPFLTARENLLIVAELTGRAGLRAGAPVTAPINSSKNSASDTDQAMSRPTCQAVSVSTRRDRTSIDERTPTRPLR